jgi:hypothetical protein
MKAQLLPTGKIQQDVFMLLTFLFCGYQVQSTGHAQMHEQMAVVAKIENNEFAAALNGGYRSVPDLLAKCFCRRLRDRAGPENPCRYDALAHKAGSVEIVYNGLHFREFGHFGSGSEVQGS